MLIPYPLEPPPSLPPLDDPWEAPGADLDSGRRLRRFPESVLFHDGPALERLDLLGPLEVRDRRIVALEEPLFVWDVETTGPVTMSAEVQFSAERVRYERAADGTSLWLGGEDPADELLVVCYGGPVEARADGDRILLEARGTDRLRLVVVAAWSEEDRDRTLRALARKGIAGVVAQQLRHNEMIAKLGVKITTPDPDVDAQLEFDKLEIESWLHDSRDGHRIFNEPAFDTGSALLALGLREPVRDVLRAPLDPPELRRLFAAYAMWAGADEFVRRHWRRCLEAVEAAERGYRTFQLDEEDRELHEEAAAALRPVAEALADAAAFERLTELGRAGEEAPSIAVVDEISTALDLWNIRPLALEGAVHLSPHLPEGWTEMTLERLRVGDSALDVRVRRRPSGVAIKVRVTRGPPVVVHLDPVLPFNPTGILVGEEQISGPRVSATVRDEVEAIWNH